MELLITTLLVITVACMVTGKPIKIQIEHKQPQSQLIPLDISEANEKHDKEQAKEVPDLADIAEVLKGVIADE